MPDKIKKGAASKDENDKSAVTIAHEQVIICSKTHLHIAGHEHTITC